MTGVQTCCSSDLERKDGNIWNTQKPIFRMMYNFFKRKEIQFLQRADCIVSLTNNARREIQSWKSMQGRTLDIQVIACCADLELFSERGINRELREEFIREHGINSDDMVISYLGSIGTWYMLEEMLAFYKCLQNLIPKTKFL